MKFAKYGKCKYDLENGTSQKSQFKSHYSECEWYGI